MSTNYGAHRTSKENAQSSRHLRSRVVPVGFPYRGQRHGIELGTDGGERSSPNRGTETTRQRRLGDRPPRPIPYASRPSGFMRLRAQPPPGGLQTTPLGGIRSGSISVKLVSMETQYRLGSGGSHRRGWGWPVGVNPKQAWVSILTGLRKSSRNSEQQATRRIHRNRNARLPGHSTQKRTRNGS